MDSSIVNDSAAMEQMVQTHNLGFQVRKSYSRRMERRDSNDVNFKRDSLRSLSRSFSSIVAQEEEQRRINDQSEKARLQALKEGKKRVSFAKVSIHEHPVIMGDNPSCGMGFPLAIDWKPVRTSIVDVTSYNESTRGYDELRLSSKQREDMLKNAGYSRQELIKLKKSVNIAKAQRVRTQETMSTEPVQESVERIGKAMKKMFRGRAARKQEAEMKKWIANGSKSLDSSSTTTVSLSSGSMHKSKYEIPAAATQ